MTNAADLAILQHLAARTHASAAEIGITCRLTASQVRACLVSLEGQRLVTDWEAQRISSRVQAIGDLVVIRRVMALVDALAGSERSDEASIGDGTGRTN